MNAAIYLRVSTDEQTESGLGLASQEARCRALVISKGWELAGVYLEEPVSGTSDPTGRPAFARLLADVAAGTVTAVVILKLDRLARRTLWVHQTIATLDAAGCAFISAAEGFDTSTPVGKMMLGMLAVIAEFEVEQIRERTRSALAQKKVRGERIGAAYLGLKVEDGVEVALPDERETAEMILTLRSQGMTLQAIADRMRTSGRATKRGGTWAPATILKVVNRAAARDLRAVAC